MADIWNDQSVPDRWRIADSMNGESLLPQGSESVVLFDHGFGRSGSATSDMAILPGAFNPIHEGHRRLRQAAEQFLACRVLYELSVFNVDKPALAENEVASRLQRIEDAPVLLTQAALFVDKARLFPGCWFVVGYDTAERLLSPEYYGHDRNQRDAALEQLSVLKTRFLVAGRLDSSSARAGFQTCDQLDLASEWNSMFTRLPESAFRVDVSSTHIRHRENQLD
jgi:hypothetical protein